MPRDYKLEYETQLARANAGEQSRDKFMAENAELRVQLDEALRLANKWWRTLADIADLVGLKDHSKLSRHLPARIAELQSRLSTARQRTTTTVGEHEHG